MKQYAATNIKNIALAGHSSAGKTSLAEALLFLTGTSDRLGTIASGTTVCDFDPEEAKRLTSVSTKIVPFEWKGNKINLLDTPGLFDFAEGMAEGIRAVETVLIAISAKSGVSVGAEKAFEAAGERGIARVFFVNKLDSDHADFAKTYAAMKEKFGVSVCPVIVPQVVNHQVKCYVNLLKNKAYSYKDGKATEVPVPDMPEMEDWMTSIHEAIAETDEALMEKYFGGEEFTDEEISAGLKKGVAAGTVCPVFCGAGQSLQAIDLLLEGITAIFPTAAEDAGEKAVQGEKEIEVTPDPEGKTAAIVFKTVADPFVGKMSYFKVISGKIAPDMQLLNMTTGELEKISKTVTVRGKKQEDAPFIGAGDIGAVTKLQKTNTGDTLCDPAFAVKLTGIESPKPSLSMAILPKKKGDEEKIAQGLLRLKEEDPTVSYITNKETHQMIVNGLGEQHLDIVAARLRSKFGVEVTLEKPKVAYRETIRKKISVQGRHKKQSGGHGQFGDVWIEFEPCDCDGLEFGERVVGGSVPKNFFPAVEKGLRDCITKGVLAGYPVVGLRATLYDGSYHPVDSSEMSFKMAAAVAYKAGIPLASPVLLEPYGSLLVTVPEDNMGDVIGEVNKRRGRVLGMNPGKSGYQVIEAEAPMADMYDFTTFLRQTTRGRGRFSLDFVRYEEAPPVVAQKIIEQAKKDEPAE